MKIIITDIFFRKSFDVFNIVASNFNPNDILIADRDSSLFNKIKATLIFRKNLYRIKYDDVSVLYNDLKKISDTFKNEEIVILPVEEDFLIVFYELIEKHKDELTGFKYLLPDKEVFHLARNKYNLQKYCTTNNFPVPELYSLENARNLKFFKPLIIKPKVGSGSKGIFFINQKADLKLLDTVVENDVLIQKRIKNSINVIGVFVLMHNNTVVNVYCHKRIRTSPSEGGVTVLSKLISNDKVVNIAIDLLKSLKWEGVAMIEFLFDEDDQEYKIIEINPRFWGSILLSEYAKIHIVPNYISIAANTGNIVTKSNRPNNLFIRWIIPYDIILFLKDLLKGKADFKKTCYINFTYSKKISAIIFIFFSFFSIKNLKKFVNKISH